MGNAARVGMAALATVAAAALQVAPAAAAAGDPIGAVDPVHVSADGSGYDIVGWAADAEDGTDITGVDISVDGGPWDHVTGYGLPRPDVQRAHPFAGPSSGWESDFPTGGTHKRVCARATDNDGHVAPIGCAALPAVRYVAPRGALDAVLPGAGALGVRGWVGDADGGPTAARITIDGTVVGDVVADGARPDVTHAFPAFTYPTGFAQTLPALPGRHTVCAEAVNTGVGGRSTALGCRTVVVSGRTAPFARGVFDEVTSQATSTAFFVYSARGWATDAGGGPALVRLRSLFVNPSFGTAGFTYGDLRTGTARPDVAAAVPGAGPDAGFDGPYAGPGKYAHLTLTCAYEVDAATGAEDFLSCRTLS